MSESTLNRAVDHDALWRTTAAKLASMSSLRISKYRISTMAHGEVIVGGFGDVRQARLRTSLFGKDTVIALKTLRPSGNREQRVRVIAALAREIDVWSKAKHTNILPLDGFYCDESSLMTAWIATPWRKNGNILQYVQAINADQETRLKLALDTARGLEYLHELSPPVCHADIKAENTLVDDNGNAQLCDFGLAKILEDVPSGLTTTRTLSCTLRYAAPELVTGTGGSHTLASDVWAWGCLLLVIITGTLPYPNKDRDVAIGVALTQKELPANTATLDVPDFISMILRRCWALEVRKRPDISWCQGMLSIQKCDDPLAAAGLVTAGARFSSGIHYDDGASIRSTSDASPFSGTDAEFMANAFRMALRKPDFADRSMEDPESLDVGELVRELAEEGRDIRSVSSTRGVTVQSLEE